MREALSRSARVVSVPTRTASRRSPPRARCRAVGAVGAGVKIQLVDHLKLRLQVKDYLSGRPDEVIAPGPGAKMSGFPNSLIGTVSVGYTW